MHITRKKIPGVVWFLSLNFGWVMRSCWVGVLSTKRCFNINVCGYWK